MENTITQKIKKHYYTTANGNEVFGGNFLEDSDTSIKENKLNGTTSIIGTIFPFGGMISPIAPLWISKIGRRETKNNDPLDIFNETNKYDDAIRKINEVNLIVDEELNRVIENGNYSEIVTLHLLENNGDINNLDSTVAREEKLDKTIFYKTDKAIEFGKLAYEEIMKLGNEVELVDYQTVACDKELWDVGYFDFVVKADGKLILIDMKTGSRVKDAKLTKVKFQLLGSYKKKFKGIFGQEPDRIVVISAVEDEVMLGQVKKYKTFGETIDITNDDPNNDIVKAYEMAAKLTKHLYDTGILKKNKKENVPMI